MSLIQNHYLQAIADGNFSFGISLGVAGLLAAALLLLAVALLSYRKTTRPLSRSWKTLLVSLRYASLLLLGFLLLEPGVLISEVTPQETYLAVLVDDSQSMGIRDRAQTPSRHEQSVELLYGRENIVERLGEKFQVRTYRFSEMAQRLDGPEALSQAGTRSALATAVNQVANELASFPLAGMVVVSDGADNGDGDPLESVKALAEKSIPVYSVAVGAPEIEKDLSIHNVNAAKSLLQDSVYQVQVILTQRGYQGQRARLSIASEGQVVAEQTVTLAGDGESRRYTLELKPREERIVVYNISVEEKPGEIIGQNNHHRFFVDNRRKKPLDVLYVEGQPRNEYKFIRRAVKDDRSLRLATYLQTGPRKFLRQGIKSPQELSDGFPRAADDLFAYEAVILGNVDRSLFNDGQLQLLQDFAARRGGGLMVVGGLNEAFVDSPLADALPVEVIYESRLPSFLQGGPRRGEHPTGAEYHPRLTRDGWFSPILRLDSGDRKNRELWQKMPGLQGLYVSGRAKPGATVLMEHPTLSYRSAALPVLSIQRYGAGRSMVLATASSWRWQMMMPHEDESHERIWRQMLRWLASESQQRLTTTLDREHYNTGDQVQVSAKLLGPDFEPDNNGILWLQVTDPQGEVEELPMDWQLEKEGTYTQSFTAEQAGVYDLQVKVPSELDSELQAQSPLLVTASRREFTEAGMDAGLMRRLATSTNGRFYTADTVHQLVDDVTFAPNAYSKLEMHSLWDQPIFLVLLVLLVSLEWFIRRYKGLS
ncbi:hypothetical protein ACXYTJ_08285 [Gilvimarinus sp. F26214L]|uniref:hypothetical protein n=1 Tax=Gilvimarinus sp. DZF01 TaxID=3461371 RepID=UPI0040468091